MFGALYNKWKKRIAMISSNLIMNLNPLMSQMVRHTLKILQQIFHTIFRRVCDIYSKLTLKRQWHVWYFTWTSSHIITFHFEQLDSSFVLFLSVNVSFPVGTEAVLRRCNYILRLATISKKKLSYRCFPVNFVKFLRTCSLKNITRRLLLLA